jgi:hypothetical protein
MLVPFRPRGVSPGPLKDSEIDKRIRQRAYEIYQARGQAGNHALDDWLKAKQEVLDTRRKSKIA